MIRIKTTNEGRVKIRVSKCKTQAQLMGEIGVTIKTIVQFALLKAKADDVKNQIATALTFGKIFDGCMKELEDAIKDGIDDDNAQEVDITVDLNDIDEIMKQLREMRDGDEE